MMEAGYEIRVGYMNRLEGLTYKGMAAPAYDEVMSDEVAPRYYLVISGQTSSDDSLKCGFSSIDLITINIIATYSLGSGTKKDVEMIAKDVISRVHPAPGKTSIVTPNLNIWSTTLITNRTQVEETSDERKIIKMLTFQHKVNHIS